MHKTPRKILWISNRLGLDYRLEAERLGRPSAAIVDVHAHINGPEACKIFDEVRRLYGVRRVYSMNQLPTVEPVKQALGDAVRFIAFPQFINADRAHAHRAGFLETIETFHSKYGSRMLKLWNSPALRDILSAGPFGATDVCEIDSESRVAACELGQKLGMMFMVHVADPDIWFRTKYSDAAKYGTKRQQYEGLERMLQRFTNPWIAAHMGGWPEDLEFLDGLLTRNQNLYLDTSATKWIVRELGKQTAERTRAFFIKWKGRLLFGSDLVVMDDQLTKEKKMGSVRGDLANSPEEAFELYASRYWTLRVMFETDYVGASPIADPDLKLVDSERYDETSSPLMTGLTLDRELLEVLYAGAAEKVVERWWDEHGGW